MEIADWEFYGIQRRPSGMSSAFRNYMHVKKRYRSFIKKIQKRIDETVTSNEALKAMLCDDLRILDDEVKRISPKNNNDMS